jgi:hypothetical protein
MAHNPRRPNYITTLPILQTTLLSLHCPHLHSRRVASTFSLATNGWT